MRMMMVMTTSKFEMMDALFLDTLPLINPTFAPYFMKRVPNINNLLYHCPH